MSGQEIGLLKTETHLYTFYIGKTALEHLLTSVDRNPQNHRAIFFSIMWFLSLRGLCSLCLSHSLSLALSLSCHSINYTFAKKAESHHLVDI